MNSAFQNTRIQSHDQIVQALQAEFRFWDFSSHIRSSQIPRLPNSDERGDIHLLTRGIHTNQHTTTVLDITLSHAFSLHNGRRTFKDSLAQAVRAKIVKYRNAYLPIAFVPCAGNSLGCIAPETLCFFRRLADLASQLSSTRGPACFRALRHRFLAEIFEATATRLLRGVSELPNNSSLQPLPTLTPLVSAVSPAPSHTAAAAVTATESSLSVQDARSYSSVIQLTSPPTGDHLASTYGWNTVFAAPSPSSTL